MPVQAQGNIDSLLFAPQAVDGAGATITANLDTKGANYASIRIAAASEANTNAVGPTISVLQSDDTVVTNFATITADENWDLTAASVKTYHIDLRGRKRYLRLTIDPGTNGTNDDIVVSAVASLSRNTNWPTNAAAMAGEGTVV